MLATIASRQRRKTSQICSNPPVSRIWASDTNTRSAFESKVAEFILIQGSIYELDLLRNPADTNSKKVEWTIGKASAAAICEMDIFCDNATKFVITKIYDKYCCNVTKKYLPQNKDIYCETFYFYTAEIFTLKLIFVNNFFRRILMSNPIQ